MSSKKYDEAEGFQKKSLIEEDDVEGHQLARGGEGINHRGADLGEGVQKRSFAGDEDDDVEGHSMVRGGDDVISRGDLGEGISRKLGPGEGLTSRN